jgi:hypothetical protein
MQIDSERVTHRISLKQYVLLVSSDTPSSNGNL